MLYGRTRTYINRWLPEGIVEDVYKHLNCNNTMAPFSDKYKYSEDAAVELLWQIQRQATKNNDWSIPDGYQTLNASILKSIRSDYNLYFQVFREAGIIEADNSYCPSDKDNGVVGYSKSYRFTSKYPTASKSGWI